MERLLQMLAVLAGLYAVYALTVKKWDYTSRAHWKKHTATLKEDGMSNTFYLIHAGTLFVLTVLSAGTFALFWVYEQWTAILRGFKRANGTTLPYGAGVRTLFAIITFFSLGGIINRTCEYLHKKATLPAAVWGVLWLGGLAAALLPLDISTRVAGYVIFCAAPAAYQHKINQLHKVYLPLAPRTREILVALLGLALVAGAVYGVYKI